MVVYSTLRHQMESSLVTGGSFVNILISRQSFLFKRCCYFEKNCCVNINSTQQKILRHQKIPSMTSLSPSRTSNLTSILPVFAGFGISVLIKEPVLFLFQELNDLSPSFHFYPEVIFRNSLDLFGPRCDIRIIFFNRKTKYHLKRFEKQSIFH